MNTRLRYALVISLCAVGLALWLWGVNYPHVGIYNANNNYLTLAAKNYLRFEFDTLKLFPTYFAGETLPSSVPYYLHHPVLIFPLSTIPFMMFGFHNWVAHVTNFLFLVGDIFLLYKIGELIWNKKVGLWAAGLATIFPMTTFFWKYIFFEQGSLFFNLLVFYFFIRYIQVQRRAFLIFVFLFTFFSGLIDWGVLYLFFPFLAFFFSKYRKPAVRVILVYLAATIASLSIFMGGIYHLSGGFADMIQAIRIRAAADELLSLPFWPLRLFVLSVIRIGLYFTPLVFVAGWFAYKILKVKKRFELQELTLSLFLIFGLLNFLVLPTATWGHSYFLFYLIPFFALSGALWIAAHEKKQWLIVAWVIVIILSSIAINYLKIQQVRKQLWKYEAAAELNNFLDPHETIGVVQFAGDVFEQYFLHPTRPMTTFEVDTWLGEEGNLQKVVVSCANGCTTEEVARVTDWSQGQTLVTYDRPPHKAWMIIKRSVRKSKRWTTTSVEQQAPPESGILRIYRMIRDILSVGQI